MFKFKRNSKCNLFEKKVFFRHKTWTAISMDAANGFIKKCFLEKRKILNLTTHYLKLVSIENIRIQTPGQPPKGFGVLTLLCKKFDVMSHDFFLFEVGIVISLSQSDSNLKCLKPTFAYFNQPSVIAKVIAGILVNLPKNFNGCHPIYNSNINTDIWAKLI